VKPSAFEYHAPASADEAVALLAELGDAAKVLAGGQSLIPMLSLRLAAFDHLIDIGRVGDLAGIHAADFFTGFWSTALEPDEVLVSVRFPVWAGRCGFAVREFARRHGDFAVAGAAVAVGFDADDRVERCSIALIGMGSTPIRSSDAETALVGTTTPPAAEEVGAMAVADLDDIPSDQHGPADYRRPLGAAMVARAWADAMTEATNA
jgi:carbon-monoxide dehydrogenase medium subunit